MALTRPRRLAGQQPGGGGGWVCSTRGRAHFHDILSVLPEHILRMFCCVPELGREQMPWTRRALKNL